jgi:hypothetical protein
VFTVTSHIKCVETGSKGQATGNATVIKKSTKRHNGRQSTKQKAEIAFDLY